MAAKTPRLFKDRAFADNGFVDAAGRLTPAGHEAVLDYVRRYHNPLGLVWKIKPTIAYQLRRLIEARRLSEEEFKHMVACEAAHAIRYYRPGEASMDSFLAWRTVQIAMEVIRGEGRRARQTIHAGEDGEMASAVADALATAGDGQGEPDEADAVRWHLRHLDPRDREVVARVTVNGELLRVVADDLGVCVERVRQIEARALAILRYALMRTQVRGGRPNG